MSINIARPRADAIISSARSIYVSACAAEITEAPGLFRRHRPRDATVTGLFTPVMNRVSYVDTEIGLRVRSFFLTRGLKQDLSTGLVEYCPWRYGMIDQWLRSRPRFDTALVMVSPPDANGKCSLGVQADFLPNFQGKIDRIVGFINPNMPRTSGHDGLDYSAFAAVVDYDVPVKSVTMKPADADAARIAEQIVKLVPDGAAVQFGIGQIPSQALARLVNHRGIRIHSGVIDDNVLLLEASGALDRDDPIVSGTAVGTRPFYHSLSKNDRFSFRPVSYTHSFRTIAGIPNFVAINSVLQVDLLGQVSAEGSGGRLVASPGGLPDFTRGALHSEGGKSIIAVRARGVGSQSGGIVPLLDMPHTATSPAVDADIVVTEFGAAHIRELPLEMRGDALIAIADPRDQGRLTSEWSRIRTALLGRS